MTALAGRKLRASQINGLAQPLRGAILAQAGVYLTTSGSTELALPKFSLSNVTVPNGGAVRFEANLRLSGGSGTAVAGDTFEMKVRQTTALTGTTVVSWRYIVPSANQASVSFGYAWIPPTAISGEVFHLSLQRIAGTGVLGVEASGLSSFNIYYVLDTSVWSNVP
jgi:hypothetical protein